MPLAMGCGGGGGGQSISEVLLGTLQIFENLYSARAMWMSPTYNEVCEMILHLQGHRDPSVRAAVVHFLPMCARHDFVRFTASYLRRTMRFYLGIGPRAVAIGLRVCFWFFAQLVTNRVLKWVWLASCMGTRS